RNGEHRPTIVRMLGPGASPLRLHRLTHDVETESGALDRGHAFVSAEETLEELLAFVGRYPDAVVTHANDHLALISVTRLLCARNLNKAFALGRIGVFDRIR